MFTGIRKTIVAGVLAGSASLVGVGASSAYVCQTDDCQRSSAVATAAHRVVPVVPADSGLELGWGIRAAIRAGALDRPRPPRVR
jgi:hypothetical protein